MAWALLPEGLDQSCEVLDVARGYVDFFEPDVLVESFPGMAEKLGWQGSESGFDAVALFHSGRLYEVDCRGRVQFAAGIDIPLDVMHHLYDEYK